MRAIEEAGDCTGPYQVVDETGEPLVGVPVSRSLYVGWSLTSDEEGMVAPQHRPCGPGVVVVDRGVVPVDVKDDGLIVLRRPEVHSAELWTVTWDHEFVDASPTRVQTDVDLTWLETGRWQIEGRAELAKMEFEGRRVVVPLDGQPHVVVVQDEGTHDVLVTAVCGGPCPDLVCADPCTRQSDDTFWCACDSAGSDSIRQASREAHDPGPTVTVYPHDDEVLLYLDAEPGEICGTWLGTLPARVLVYADGMPEVTIDEPDFCVALVPAGRSRASVLGDNQEYWTEQVDILPGETVQLGRIGGHEMRTIEGTVVSSRERIGPLLLVNDAFTGRRLAAAQITSDHQFTVPISADLDRIEVILYSLDTAQQALVVDVTDDMVLDFRGAPAGRGLSDELIEELRVF